MNPAIDAEGLSKRYALSESQPYGSLREHLVDVFTKRRRTAERSTIWALKDVSFSIEQGEVCGIIGRNGAGKSTLLKILSRITKPTAGHATVVGRVGSLLEVGTGFHPELTGRENVYLSGAILGMKRAEIARKFDEIVAFAEVEQFVGTPVKRYSSGMYMRLAFAVAAHLETEILLVDEVLAVGDMAFQAKCLGRMGDVARQGRTVLFVSHNMSAIVSLCRRAILLERGAVEMIGDVAPVVSRYASRVADLRGSYRARDEHQPPRLRIDSVTLLRGNTVSPVFYNSETMTVRIEYSARETLGGAQIAFEVLTELQECLFSTTNQDWDGLKEELAPGHYVVDCPVDLRFFRPGQYYVQASSSIPSVEVLDIMEESVGFQVHDDSSPVLKLGQGRRGVILPVIQWKRREDLAGHR